MTQPVVTGFFPRLPAAESALVLLRCMGFVQDQVRIRFRTLSVNEGRSWMDVAYEAIPEGATGGLLSGALAGLLFAVITGGPATQSVSVVAWAWIGAFAGMIAGIFIRLAAVAIVNFRSRRRARPAGLVIEVRCPHSDAASIAKEVFQQTGAIAVE